MNGWQFLEGTNIKNQFCAIIKKPFKLNCSKFLYIYSYLIIKWKPEPTLKNGEYSENPYE